MSRRRRLNLWCPMPPSASGIADYAAEQLPILRERFEVAVVAAAPAGARPAADIDLYQVGNSPAHVYVYRAALERPGVVLLHDDCLNHLVLAEAVERGDRRGYLREMRRCYGERGSFLGRQVLRGLGGSSWPALLPLNDRLLESSLALVGLTRYVTERATPRLHPRPVLHLPHHLALPLEPWPSRAEARRALGLDERALVVTAPGLASAAKRIDVALRAVARLRRQWPALRLVVAGGVDPGFDLQGLAASADPATLLVTGRLSLEDFLRHLAAADVIVALRFPSHGEISGALVRSLGAGRAALVSSGTPAAEEFPEGLVVPVDPDRFESAEAEALLGVLLADPALREGIGARARAHVSARHALRPTTERLMEFVESVADDRERLEAALPPKQSGPLGELLDEIHFAARDLELPGAPEGLGELLAPLCRATP